MARITKDPENRSTWWTWALRHQNIPKVLWGFIDEAEVPLSIEVTEKEAREVLEWAEQIYGWNDGPSYSPHPLIINFY